jgi:hypothetical protein
MIPSISSSYFDALPKLANPSSADSKGLLRLILGISSEGSFPFALEDIGGGVTIQKIL